MGSFPLYWAADSRKNQHKKEEDMKLTIQDLEDMEEYLAQLRAWALGFMTKITQIKEQQREKS